jgi:hypothetical protein
MVAVVSGATADVTIENARATLVLSDDATCRSLLHKADGRECIAADANVPIASVRHGGNTFSAESVALDGDAFTVTFDGTDTVLEYAIERHERWIVFRLVAVRGTRPESLSLLRVPVAITANVGRRLNAAWDDQTTVCVMAANRQADCRGAGAKYTTLTASTQDAPGPRMEGAAVALIVCPTEEFKTIAREASHAFGLLTNEAADGTPVKDTDLARGSYWFLRFSEAEVDRVIEHCNAMGIKQVMMSSASWCTSPGHYAFDTAAYPDGRESLKRAVAKLHANGILVGMHNFVSKVSKKDPYVTPIPDTRFWTDRQVLIAEAIDAEQTEIRSAMDLREWPGSTVCSQTRWEGGVVKHQDVIIGDEIVQYERIGPDGKWDTFLGCTRGAWGTNASAHAAGETARHYGVDGCINGYIIDQETSLMDEVAERIADIFNYCGFDMVYFDGSEDVDRRRFSYYVANFHEQAMRRFTKRPIIHMGGGFTHLSWHSYARTATCDTYLNTLRGAIISGATIDEWPTVKDHIDRSVRRVIDAHQDMTPGELGWFGIWPKGNDTDGLQLDEAEYLMCKSLAYDAPVSLQTSFAQMEAHPLTPGILEIVREYERLRMARAVPEDVTEKLRELGRDFAMLQQNGKLRFVPVEAVPLVDGEHDVRAFVGELGDGSLATIWHYLREGHALLDLDPAEVTLTDFAGEPLEFETEAGKALIPIGSRRNTLICNGVSVDDLRAALTKAEVRERQPAMIFVSATDCHKLAGEMALGSTAGVTETEALGDFILCTGRPSTTPANEWYAEYTVELPHDGRWTLWARVRYPTGSDYSFWIAEPGDEMPPSAAQVLGNCGVNEKKWHWTGRGGGTASVPPGQPITFTREKGPFTFRIYAREGGGTTATNPRLDLLCLADDPAAVPTDETARKALAR